MPAKKKVVTEKKKVAKKLEQLSGAVTMASLEDKVREIIDFINK